MSGGKRPSFRKANILRKGIPILIPKGTESNYIQSGKATIIENMFSLIFFLHDTTNIKIPARGVEVLLVSVHRDFFFCSYLT